MSWALHVTPLHQGVANHALYPQRPASVRRHFYFIRQVVFCQYLYILTVYKNIQLSPVTHHMCNGS